MFKVLDFNKSFISILGVIIVASSTVLLSCEYTLISVSVPNTCCNNPSPTTFFILSS